MNRLLVLGLGNPGEYYQETRHNAGYITVNKLLVNYKSRFSTKLFSSWYVSRISQDRKTLILLRYKGYMNHSGRKLSGIIRKYRSEISDLIVIVDSMDLPAGTCRLRRKGKDAGHNGLKSIQGTLNTDQFTRISIGIGRPAPGESVIDHVLGNPGEEEKLLIESACERAAQAVIDLMHVPFDRIAESLNRKLTSYES